MFLDSKWYVGGLSNRFFTMSICDNVFVLIN